MDVSGREGSSASRKADDVIGRIRGAYRADGRIVTVLGVRSSCCRSITFQEKFDFRRWHGDLYEKRI